MTDTSSRRDFIQKAGAAAAFSSVLSIGRTNELIAEALARPVRVARPPEPIAPDDPVRIGVIGTGGMGTGHVDAFLGLAKQGKTNVQIVALADVCKPRLEAAKQKV
ncbi:MAG: twin-arginine translocation signal domain-containing protein, partial [Gemmatimonadota bacterium]